MDPLGNLIDCIAVYGLYGLFAIGLAERFVPVLPSYGVLVAVGIAVSDSSWSVAVAIAMTTTGSFVGGLTVFLLVRALGQDRSNRLLYRTGSLLALSRGRIDGILSSFRTRERLLIFVSQVVPTVRLIAPLVAGLVQTRMRFFAAGTAAGIALWNGLFISVGYTTGLIAPETNASALALKVLIVLVLIEALLAAALRFANRRTSRPVARSIT
ncbi:membrane protein DedA with SNARE-associated domain [Tardiphaga robiniae]|jgi:membrane protein DedA with SNARE-associated domain|uniref:DedA family protein n=1 Tax=Tardiphaga robiniae TaxID=943830 RepID=UPI002854C9AB|nr:VTT domain-containing protein [Tardiphaga robiniae]MDR6659363.1 membrane protein DedA with SNARE-associated domain [Tardiphaga robiniae]